MLILRLAALLAFLFVPGYLIISLILKKDGGAGGAERVLLAAVCGCGVTALLGMTLGLASRFGPLPLGVAWSVLCLALLVPARRRLAWLARVRWQEWAALALLALIGLALFLPPGRVVFGWNDEGIYPNIAARMDNQGDIHTAVELVTEVAPERRSLLFAPDPVDRGTFEAFLYKAYFITDFTDGEVVPQFYYLWPSLMAVFSVFLGQENMFYAVTCAALLSLCGIYLLARRMLGGRWSWVAALLAAFSPLMMYFSRSATSEMLTLAFFSAACLALLACQEDEQGGQGTREAALAGALLTLCMLTRIDMYLLLPPLLLVFLWRRLSGAWKRADTAFIVLLLLGFCLSMLVGRLSSPPYFTATFTLGPEGKGMGYAALLLLAAAALSALFLFPRPLRGLAEKACRPRRFWKVFTWVALAAVFVFFYFVRPHLPMDSILYPSTGDDVWGPGYNTQNLVRWGWYFSFPGLLLVFTGYGLAMTSRIRRSWSPMLAAGLGFTVFYLWNMRCNPLQIMMMRRIVPVIFPLAVLMLAYALKRLFHWPARDAGPSWKLALRPLGMVGASLLILYLALFSIKTSWPMFGLEEGGNQLPAVEAVSGAAAEGTVLMDYDSGDLFGPPLLSFEGRRNAWLSGDQVPGDERFPALLTDLGFPGRPVYLLRRPRMSGGETDLAEGLELDYVDTVTWREENLESGYRGRPDQRTVISEPFILYRIVPAR